MDILCAVPGMFTECRSHFEWTAVRGEFSVPSPSWKIISLVSASTKRGEIGPDKPGFSN